MIGLKIERTTFDKLAVGDLFMHPTLNVPNAMIEVAQAEFRQSTWLDGVKVRGYAIPPPHEDALGRLIDWPVLKLVLVDDEVPPPYRYPAETKRTIRERLGAWWKRQEQAFIESFTGPQPQRGANGENDS